MPLKLITAPTVEPITVAEAKLNLRVTGSALDGDLTRWIGEAREAVEHITGRALLLQTWEKALDGFPTNEIELPRPPVIGIASVKYIDPAGAEQTLAANRYTLDNSNGYTNAWLLAAYGTRWPDTLDTANAVKVRYTAGYGSQASDVPFGIKGWMHLYIAEAFKNPGLMGDFKNGILPFGDRLLDRFRIMEAV